MQKCFVIALIQLDYLLPPTYSTDYLYYQYVGSDHEPASSVALHHSVFPLG